MKSQKNKEEILISIVFLIGVMLAVSGFKLSCVERNYYPEYWTSFIRPYGEFCIGGILIFFIPFELIYKIVKNVKLTKDDLCIILLIINLLFTFVELFICLGTDTRINLITKLYDNLAWNLHCLLSTLPVAIIISEVVICTQMVNKNWISFIANLFFTTVCSTIMYYNTYSPSVMKVFFLLCFGFVFWNLCITVKEKKIKLLWIGISILMLAFIVILFVVLEKRIETIRYYLHPELDPYGRGWELIQIRKLWEKDYSGNIQYGFWREHHMLDLIWNSNAMLILGIIGLAMIFLAVFRYLILHTGPKRYLVLGLICYIFMQYLFNLLSSVGLFPCTTIALPFTGFNPFIDTYMAIFILRCTIPRNLFNKKKFCC